MSRPVLRACLTTAAAVTVTAGLIAATAYASGGTAASALLTTASCSQSYLPLPDPACTPGATNPDVTQATIGSTICVSGWTATIRPSTTYTNGLKKQGIIDYGYTDTSMSDYEEDHVRHEALHYRAGVRGLPPPGCRSSPVKLRAA
ncbi:hypothetical protein AB0L41_42535 [Amycolatopsis mediterranei]|uniref:hypothetical protein n=1 Tax=Amycolatopsis mediterranei TaxID=33910 RepID=UPI0034382B81